MIAAALRGLAIAIAIVAAVDPAVTTARRIRPEVAVVATDAVLHRPLADRIERSLRDEFRVLRAPFSGAAATVIAGDAPPDGVAAPGGGPVFAVAPEQRAPGVVFEAVEVPARAPLDAAIPVDATLRIDGAAAPIDVVLEANGVAVDRIAVGGGDAADARQHVRLTFVPAAAGPVALRVIASADGIPPASADAVVTVAAERWSVLFHDTRPSWQSTFVRRALERDPRFTVAFRAITSRNASVAAGEAPASLTDAAALARFDAIVVGAPEGLSDAEVTALERFARNRGGSVLLLPDGDEASAAYARLTGAEAWADVAGTEPRPVVGTDSPDTLRASALRFPRVLPAGARVFAADEEGNAVVWESPLGAGRVVVSGAVDAWRLRDPAASDFDAFWRARVAAAAAAAPAPLEARLAQSVLRPGEETVLEVAVRDVVLAEAAAGVTLRADVAAALEGANVIRPLRVLPEGSPGLLRARVRAPDAPGLYHVRVAGGGGETRVALLVAEAPALARADRIELLRTWTTARGGEVLAAADAGALPAALARALPDVRRSETWHPMRSPWWIVPFALLLGAEWWWRRRRGRA